MEHTKLKVDKLIETMTNKGLFKTITDNDIETLRLEILNIVATSLLDINNRQRALAESAYNDLVK